MTNYLNLIRKTNNSGFTLVELLLASVGMFFVVMAAGYGVFVMARENVTANAAGDIQYNLGRAVDFISEEVKTASAVVTGAALPTGCGTGTSTLKLTIPYTVPLKTPTAYTTAVGTSSPYDVYYYTKTPDSPWIGSNAIYRCGPSLNSDGSVAVNQSPSPGTGLPVSPSSQILVDLIASTRDSNDTGTCVNGGTAFPGNNVGFFVCINGKNVEIHAASSALNNSTNQLGWIGTNTNSRLYGQATYGIVTQAYARANTSP